MTDAPSGRAPDRHAPRVLLTNDDGWRDEGLTSLLRVVREFAEVTVVAPAEEQSAVGHALTLRGTLEAVPMDLEGARAAYAVRGTPADCAKLAIRSVLEEPPALCVSGLNPGPNVGVNVFYSGTVAAALEAAANGVPGIALSRDLGDVPLPTSARLVAPLLRAALERGLPPWHVLNVNIPALPPAEVRGVRLTRHGVSGFDERYREHPPGPGGSRLFSLEGEMCLRDAGGTTDAQALAEGYVSVTPMALDLTARTLPGPGADGPSAETWGWVCEAGLRRP